METNREFEAFVRDRSASPPESLSQSVLARARAELDPSIPRIFAKLSFFHAAAGAATLSICPQFGFRLFGEGMGLMHYFMGLGSAACVILCGFLFLASSLLLAATLLSAGELKKLRENRALGLTYLILLSVGFFVMVDAQVVLGFLALWTLGSVAGGVLGLEAVWGLRRRAYSV